MNLDFLFSLFFLMAVSLRSFCFFWVTSCLYTAFLASAKGESQFLYTGFHGANLKLDGIAELHPNGLLQLTNTSNQQAGHAIYRSPIQFNASSSRSAHSFSFSTTFVFAMVPELPNLGGHGLAFFISPSMDFSHATATQYLGLLNRTNNGLSTNHVLAIEFDSARSPEFNDINNNHVGIIVNDMEAIQSAPVSFFDREGEKKSLSLISGEPIQVWIDYDEEELLLNVTLAPITSPRPKRPLMSRFITLSKIFSGSMYVGFSAATGSIASDHYILGWSFNKSGEAQNLEISKLPQLPRQRKARDKLGPLGTTFIVLAAVLLVVIAGVAYYIWRKKYKEIYEEWERQYSPHRISYKNLFKATKGFNDKELLGAGGFGKVYKGKMGSGEEIAVKRISQSSNQGMREFLAEIASMGRLRHRNLVKLQGYCRRKDELLLVYDYMPNGSLDKLLYGKGKPNLDWPHRFHIIQGVASALLYLHEEWEQIVLHRDIKPSNILLDADMNARLGDFGLARLHDHDTNLQTTNLVGTIGYLAPELTRTGKATKSTDVFSFGVFMLEVACGRRSIEMREQRKDLSLVEWIVKCWKTGYLLDVSDPRLQGNYVVEQMELVLKLGLLCSHSIPETRPGMRQVMQYLDGNDKFLDVTPATAEIGIYASNSSNEVSDLQMLFTSSFENGSSSFTSMSDPILERGSCIHSC